MTNSGCGTTVTELCDCGEPIAWLDLLVVADQGAQGTAAATNTRYSTVPSRLGSQTAFAGSTRRGCAWRARASVRGKPYTWAATLTWRSRVLPYRLRSSTPSDVWHFGRHNGHELDVGFER